MIIKSSNIFALIWFHRNISVSKYVTKFFGSELFLRKTLFFLSTKSKYPFHNPNPKGYAATTLWLKLKPTEKNFCTF